jgi:hypothetical protein
VNLAVKLTLAASGIFLVVGMIGGILKYHGIMTRPSHRAHPYIDIDHRASLMYSFAALVMAQLLLYSPYSLTVQLVITLVPLFFFATAIGQYYRLGLQGKITNQFKQPHFIITWGMLLLIVGELGGVSMIVRGFISTQLLA